MATKPRPTDTDILESRASISDFASLWEHMKENPVWYASAAGFVLICAIAGLSYRAYTGSGQREITSSYARALKHEEPALRAEALAPLTLKKSSLQPELIYMHGESAYEARDYGAARESFERLRAEYPNYGFTPDAVEGLGFIAEDEDEFGVAIERFQEVYDNWPESFAALRQPFNQGRVHERAGNMEGAIEAYRLQLDVFPGSSLARRAQQALDRLRVSHPEYFPEEDLAPLVTIPGVEDEVEVMDPLEIQLPDFGVTPLPEEALEAPGEEAIEMEEAAPVEEATEEAEEPSAF